MYQSNRLSRVLCLVALLLLLCGARRARAATYYVSPSGKDLPTAGSKAQPFQTIQYAIDQTTVGDLILLQDGVYNATSGTQPDSRDVNLTAPGSYYGVITLQSVNGPAHCILDGSNTSPLVNAPAPPVDGITFRNSPLALYMGGTGFQEAEVTNCVFTNNKIGINGSVYGNFPLVRNCTFTNNDTALTLSGGIGVENCTFTDNTYGIVVDSSTDFGDVSSCTFTGNAVGMTAANGDYSISSCTFQNNIGPSYSSGFSAESHISDCTFENSTNKSFNYGGAVETTDISYTSVIRCVFINNSAPQGGAAYTSDGSTISLSDSILIGNSAQKGGAVYAYTPDSEIDLYNCTLAGNSAPQGGAASGGGKLVISNSILYFNQGGEIVPDAVGPLNALVDHCDIQGGIPAGVTDKGGNFDQDPRFLRNPGTLGASDPGDVHLLPFSPCINVGNNATVTLEGEIYGNPSPIDLDGNPRIVFGIVDLGAYEVQAPQDVSAQIGIVRGGFTHLPGSSTFVQKLTLTNTGNALVGPLYLALDSLPAGVTLSNAVGVTVATAPTGSPYVVVSGSGLGANTTQTLILRFSDPAHKAIAYSTRALTGTP